MAEAQVDWGDLDAVAVTYGPGLIGSLLVGVNVAKALAVAHDLPLVGVNHIEGHIYANWLTDAPAAEPLSAEPAFPLLCLVVSGGHTQLVLMRDHGSYRCSGRPSTTPPARRSTRWAGCWGCRIRAARRSARPQRAPTPPTRFPRARTAGPYDFSFSGLKTAVLREVAGYRERGEPIPVDGLAAAFEEAVVDALATKTVAAAEEHGVAAVAIGRRRGRQPLPSRNVCASASGAGLRCSSRRPRGAPTTGR